MQHPEHLRLLRVFHLIYGALVLFAAFFVPSMQRAFGWEGPAFGIGIYAVLAVLAMLHLGAGIALEARGGRPLSIVAAVVSLPSLPFGTALGIYALVVHFAKERFDEVPG